jgi:ribosomal protein S18 acetylase RimI-like enzyme
MNIRPANSGDIEALALLTSMATEGCAECVWEHLAQEGESALEAGQRLIVKEQGIFSFHHAMVLADGHQVRAMLSARHFKSAPAPVMDEYLPFVRPLIRLEQHITDSWYIAALAVMPEYRRRGLATQLLEAAEVLATSMGVQQLSVIVASGNEEAMTMLTEYGFSEQAREPMVRFAGLPHRGEWTLLVKGP